MKRFSISIILLIFFIGVVGLWALLTREGRPTGPGERPPYYIIVDEVDAEYLMYTEVKVTVGDELITSDNKLYRVVEVQGNRAKARLIHENALDAL